MNEFPRLQMLYPEFKLSPSSCEIANPIKKAIVEYFGDDGEKYIKEIKELEALRNSALRPPRDVSGCLTLKRYYSQLYTLYNKFKLSGGDLQLTFTWQDIYSGDSVSGDIQFELNCIMYNIGALHAELGALNARDNYKNLQIACTHFQCSVWAFEQLKDLPQNRSRDISHDIIGFLYQTMMAQAQECFLERSVMENRKSSTISLVAAQVIDYYNCALSVLIQSSLNTDLDIVDIVGSKLYKEWKKFTEFKISYYSAMCALFMGDACGEQQKTGEQIAWYLSGTQHLEQAEKLSKSIGKIELNFLTKTLTKKKEAAEKDNDFVYHQSVPSADKLTAVKGRSLVEGVGFKHDDPEVCGKDIFAQLTPIEAHEMASEYSERKDRKLREIRCQVEEKDEELLAYLSSLQLDKHNLRPAADMIPDDLIEICAELSVKPNVCRSTLKEMEELNNLTAEVQYNIDEATKLIQEESEKERKHQEKFGKRAPSLIIIELEKELKKHEVTQKQGQTSNQNLSVALEKFSKDIQLLIDCSAKDLERILPPVTDIPFDEANIKEIEKLLDKVQEMKDQRMLLMRQLRDEMQKDDVLQQVVAHSKDEIETIFERELAKYDGTIKMIHQNMTAQENILNALTNASATYGKSRMALNEISRLRANRIQTLLSSFDNFMKVKTNIEKGKEFYSEFTGTTAKLLTRLKSLIKVQDEERAQFVESQVKKETFNLRSLSISNKRLPHEAPLPPSAINGTPKLKDFLPYMNIRNNPNPAPYVPPSTYPTGNSPIPTSYPQPAPTVQSMVPQYPPIHQQQPASNPIPQQMSMMHQPQVPLAHPQPTQMAPSQHSQLPSQQQHHQPQQPQPSHQHQTPHYQQTYPNQSNIPSSYQNYYYPMTSSHPQPIQQQMPHITNHHQQQQQQQQHQPQSLPQPAQQYQISTQPYYQDIYSNRNEQVVNQNYYHDYYQQTQPHQPHVYSQQQVQHQPQPLPQSQTQQHIPPLQQQHLQSHLQYQQYPQQPQIQINSQQQFHSQQQLQSQQPVQSLHQVHTNLPQPLQPQPQPPLQPQVTPIQQQSQPPSDLLSQQNQPPAPPPLTQPTTQLYSQPQSQFTQPTSHSQSTNQQSEANNNTNHSNTNTNNEQPNPTQDLLSQFDPLWA